MQKCSLLRVCSDPDIAFVHFNIFFDNCKTKPDSTLLSDTVLTYLLKKVQKDGFVLTGDSNSVVLDTCVDHIKFNPFVQYLYYHIQVLSES